MSIDGRARVALELMVGADPIRGSIEHADGSRQVFWGWLELIESLRRAAAESPRQAAHPGRSTRPRLGDSDEPEAQEHTGGGHAVTREQ